MTTGLPVTRRSAGLGLCVLSGALLLPACVKGGGKSAGAASHPMVGVSAPGFELPAPDGKGKVSLSAYSGKVVIAQVDTDASHLGRRASVAHPVHGDVRATLARLTELVKPKKSRAFLDRTLKKHQKLIDSVAGRVGLAEHRNPVMQLLADAGVHPIVVNVIFFGASAIVLVILLTSLQSWRARTKRARRQS